MTCVNFLLNPVVRPMLINENKKLGNINSPPSNSNIRIMPSGSSEVPSAFIKLLCHGPTLETIWKKKAINPPFVAIDVITAKNARENLHLQTPFRTPSLVKTEKGPTWRNLVIPKDPLMILIA